MTTANPGRVRLGLLLVLGAVLINLAVAVYNVVVLEQGMLAGLAVLRALMTAAGVALLVTTIGRLRFEADLAVEHARYLRQWVLRDRQPRA